jgi:glyoxylase-like metal-dependent hydrolase (beta-lactamase superfamily II)
MRAVSVHRDALVVTSRMWQTNATALRAGAEAVLIDAPYFPDELEALPALLGQAGFEPDGLLATHADFDHLLGKLAFPDLPLGVGEETALRLRAEPGAAQRHLRDQDERHYVTRPAPLSLGAVQPLPVPGRLDVGDQELGLHPAEGHAADGCAVFARALGVLVVGDYLSDVEIPMISPGGSVDAYAATLARLAPLVDEAETTVPGHGSPHGRGDALRILDEDVEYLDALARGEERPALPHGRSSGEQRRIHAANVASL